MYRRNYFVRIRAYAPGEAPIQLPVTSDLLEYFDFDNNEYIDEIDLKNVILFSEAESLAKIVLERARTSVWSVDRNYLSMLRTSLRMVQLGYAGNHRLLLSYRSQR